MSIKTCTYTDIDPNTSARGKRASRDILGWFNAASPQVFKGVLKGTKSTSSANAQGMPQNMSPRYSNKSLLTTWVWEVPHVSVWAHPYNFDGVTIYEFVSVG